MSKETLRRGFLRALAVLLATAALVVVVPGIVEDFTGGSVHGHHGWVLVAANVLVLGFAGGLVWLAVLSWRQARPS